MLPDLGQIDFTDASQQQAQLELFNALKDEPAILFESCQRLIRDDAREKHHVSFIFETFFLE